MYRSAVAIEDWLSQSGADGASKRRSTSPKKRKLDSDVNPDDASILGDPDTTPRSPRSSQPTVSKSTPLHAPAPSLIWSSAPQSGVSISSNTTTRTKRPFSPIKNTADLQRLDKPVIYHSVGVGDDLEQLPGDVAGLWGAVYDVVVTSTGIYPSEIRSEITSLQRRPPPESHFGPAAVERAGTREALVEEPRRDTSLNSTIADEFPDQLPAIWAFARASTQPSVTRKRLAQAELLAVQNIIREALRCMNGEYSEAVWNSKVHEPLLELALFRHDPHVRHVNATSAKILPAFVPTLLTGNTTVKGKMIDFVLTRCFEYENPTPADAELAAAIQAKLERQPGGGPFTVNQTDYTPLNYSPVAVAIETKGLGASAEEGRVQLAVWTAAWHRRMEALGIGGRGQAPLPTLPLVLVMNQRWSLFFAWDRGTKIDILGSMDMGSTNSIHGVYQLLAVLRLLADWIDDVFYKWAVVAFTP